MLSWSQQAAAQIFRIAEMNTRQIKALHLEKTAVLIPGGILEEHGPYLPSYTDGYAIDAYTHELGTGHCRQTWMDGSPVSANSAGQ